MVCLGDDKPAVDDGHHIQADAGDYVVNSKSLSRTNGCIPANRMNITANPLADADNKVRYILHFIMVNSNLTEKIRRFFKFQFQDQYLSIM